MCTVLYLASDHPLPETVWDPGEPSFHLQRPPGELTRVLEAYLSKPNIYYVGTEQKCGCDFSYGPCSEGMDDEEEIAKTERALGRLIEVLREATIGGSEAEILLCPAGHEKKVPEENEVLSIEEINFRTFDCERSRLIRLRAYHPARAD